MVANIRGKDVLVHGRLIRIAGLLADTYEFVEDPLTFIEELKNFQPRVDLFTFMQRLPQTAPKFDFPLVQDNLAALPVSDFDTWWTKQIDNKTRNMVRRAEKKGVVVRQVAFSDELVRGICEVYNECPVRQGKPFAHYGSDFETVRKEAATFADRSVFIGAFFEDALIGFIKLLPDETLTQAGLANIVSMIQHRDKAPTNALVAEAVRCCAERGIPYLVYSRFSDGEREAGNLVDFKQNNGFRRVELPRYYVPLTWAGRIGYQLGAHKRLADRIPQSLVLKLRAARNAWYGRRLVPSMEKAAK